jgi:ABC-type nickel/cobalt efflux system permease component RcnA
VTDTADVSLKSWAGVALLLVSAAGFVAAGVNIGVWSADWWLIVIPLSFVGFIGGRLFTQGMKGHATERHQT